MSARERTAARTYRLVDASGSTFESREKGTLGGYRRAAYRIYGRLDCPSALRQIAKGHYVTYRVFFADEATAVAAGYRPCYYCLREKYEAWRAKNS